MIKSQAGSWSARKNKGLEGLLILQWLGLQQQVETWRGESQDSPPLCTMLPRMFYYTSALCLVKWSKRRDMSIGETLRNCFWRQRERNSMQSHKGESPSSSSQHICSLYLGPRCSFQNKGHVLDAWVQIRSHLKVGLLAWLYAHPGYPGHKTIRLSPLPGSVKIKWFACW